jgi:flagellar hook assembly protein FlgD
VLKREAIAPESLRGTASFSLGRLIYVPVIFGRSAGKYDIVLHSERRAIISEFKIAQKNKTIYRTSRQEFQPKGSISLTWDGRSSDRKVTPAGRYELHIKAKLEQFDAPPEPASVSITFEHNPQWLK